MPILDCRDTRISLWQDSGAQHSPGFVLLDGTEYRFGQAAREQSRLRPRDSNSRFWWQLGTQALKPALGTARHTADLVHAHLRHLHAEAGSPETLALAVPDSMPREQLSLLLGIAQACEFKVAGLISRSVLLGSHCAALDNGSSILHLEAQLNQTIVNELSFDGERITLTRSTPLPACGLLALQERCVSAIASAFIQQTRFDPRRSAGSEQQLYNELPSILAALNERGEVSVDIDGHRCRVTSAAFSSISDKLLAGVQQARPSSDVPLLLDAELQQIPGISGLPGPVSTLNEDALWHAWSAQKSHVEEISKDNHLVDRLPRLPMPGGVSKDAQSVSDDSHPAPRSANQRPVNGAVLTADTQATHVLIDTRALPLRGDEIVLGEGYRLREADGQWTLHGNGALVNGLPSSPQQALQLGDTLSLGPAGHGRLIKVME